jgi:hypothetical protein
MRTLFILCFVFALVLVFCVSGLTEDDTSPSAITARIAELSPPDKDIPDNPIILDDEIRRINQELEETRKSMDAYERQIKDVTTNKDLAAKTIQEIGNLNCDSSPADLIETLLDQVDRRARALSDAFSNDASNPWASVSTEEIRKGSPKQRCDGLKKITADADLLTFVDKKLDELKTIKTETGRLVDALQKRQATLSQRNQAAETKSYIFQDLWIIIGVIGLLSIGTIFVITLFAPDLQQQWITSGQVIQFVTVMILLSVIMALGLASILKENTLGTLLGGIAGYVLSQGVGRAAAQAVKEGILRGTPATAPRVAPVIAAVTPNNGPAAGGTAVAITGVGFDSVTSVMFGNAPATINRQSSTAVEVTVPAGQAGAVDVTVTNMDGQSVTSPGGFQYA